MAKKRKRHETHKINYNANLSKNERYRIDLYRTASTLLPNLQSFRKSLAKVANNRLRELEAAGLDFYAYDIAADYLRTRLPEGKKKLRFSESLKPTGSEKDIKHEITVLQGFLSMPTSTVSGMRKVEKKRIATFSNWKPADKKNNENYKGINMGKVAQTKVFYKFLNSKAFENLRKFYSSEQIFKAYIDGNISGTKSQKKIQQAMTDYVNSTQRKSITGLYESVGATPIPNSANK